MKGIGNGVRRLISVQMRHARSYFYKYVSTIGEEIHKRGDIAYSKVRLGRALDRQGGHAENARLGVAVPSTWGPARGA